MMKRIGKRYLTILLTLIMLSGLLLALELPAFAGTVASGNNQTWISGLITFDWTATSEGTSGNGATGSVSVSNGVLTISATSSKFKSGTCSDTNAESTTTTVTAKNASSYPVLIETLSVSGATVSGVAQGDTIAPNSQFTVSITASPNSSSDSSTRTATGTVTLVVSAQTSVTITAAASPYVGYSINGHSVAQNGSNVDFEVDAGSSVSLPSITAPDGYTFAGWRVGASLTSASSFTANSAYTIYPVITNGSVGANFLVGSTTYTFWEDAVGAAIGGSNKTVVVNANTALSGDILTSGVAPTGGTYTAPTASGVQYNLPSGITLVVPYNANNSYATTTASANTTYTTPTEFRRLTMESGASLVCDGAICVMSQIHSASGSANTAGAPTGPFGRIQLDAGSSVTIKSGASLYAYGFITGAGTITAKDGASIHETFQIGEFGGGSRYYAMQRSENKNTYKVFPFNQYYVQNIEAPITYEYGSTETVHSALYASSSSHQVDDITYIGKNAGLFLLGNSSTKLTRQYLPAEDRMEYIMEGGATLGSISLSVSIGISVSVDSGSFVLPVTSNMFIHVKSGTTTLSKPTEMLPGSKLVVDDGATINVSSNLFVYDSYEWVKATNGASEYSGTSAGCHEVGAGDGYGFVYSNKNLVTAWSPTKAYSRTSDNLEDAIIDVNGTLNVTGYLNTTTSGAEIISSDGTGQVIMSQNGAQSLYQATSAGGSSTSGYVGMFKVNTTNAQLKNGAAYEGTDDAYVQTAAGGTGTYKYNKATEQWYKYKVNYLFNSATIFTDYIYKGTSVYSPDGLFVRSVSASVGSASVGGDNKTITVTGVTSSDSNVTITGDPYEYKPVFLLNEYNYVLYQRFTGNTITETRTLGDNTYYVVQAANGPMTFGGHLDAPANATMGVTPANYNSITWRLSDSSVGAVFGGTVPGGETIGEESYIFGFYSGSVVSVTESGTTSYYTTLERAFEAMENNKAYSVVMLADCGTYEEEDATAILNAPAGATLSFDLNGHTAVGYLINNHVMTLDLNGGVFKRDSAAVQTSASAAIMNMGTLTITNSGAYDETHGVISNNSWRATSSIYSATTEAHQAVVRNSGENAKLTIGTRVLLHQPQTSQAGTTNTTWTSNLAASAGIVNVNGATILDTKADITVPKGYAIFNFSGVINSISGGSYSSWQGIYNWNMRTGSATNASPYKTPCVARIDSISGLTIYCSDNYAIRNASVIGTISGCNFSAVSYTIYNVGGAFYYNSNLVTQIDSSSGGYFRNATYDTTNVATIDSISGTNTIAARTSYAISNIGGGVIHEITGTQTITAPNYAINNSGTRTAFIKYTYGNKVGGNSTKEEYTYGEPSHIDTISGNGTIKATTQYGILNYAYIGSISGVTISANINALCNLGNTSASTSTYVYNRYYTDTATASTEYKREQSYTKNLEKGATIGTISGVTLQGTGSKAYQVLHNQGHIGTMQNVTIGLADGATGYGSASYVFALNGDSRIASYSVEKNTNCTSTDYEKLTVSAGVVTRTDTDYIYDVPTIDLMDHVTITTSNTYGLKNSGKITSMQNCEITASQYALLNSATGPYTERKSLKYGSAAAGKIFTDTKYTSELVYWYMRDPAEITTIDTCTITTPANTYAMQNSGHVGTIRNSTFQAGTTTAKAYALYNGSSREREYTYNLEDILYVTANAGSSCTAYYGTNGESKVIVYDYDAPVIDLIGEGNTFKATTTVLANTGTITAIDSGAGTLTTITGSSAKGSSIYNYSACLDARTTTTPYTAAASAGASGTAGTAVNTDTLLTGAQIGTIKNVYINANGYGILNGDAGTGKTPTIGEIGEGTEIYAHCTTAGYHAIYNQANAKITKISGGVYTVTKATTNAYKNNNTAEGYATVITGGDFKGMSATRDNAIFEPNNTARQTYGTAEQPMKLSANSRSVNFNNGTTVAEGTGYYYIAAAYTVTFDMQSHAVDSKPDDQTIEQGLKANAPDAPVVDSVVQENGVFYRFDGWYKESGCTNAWNFSSDTVTANTTIYAKWTELSPVAKIGTTNYLTLTDAVTAAQDGDTITMLADETLFALVDFTGKSVTLDLNGHTVSRNGTALRVQNGGTLTLQDSVGDGKVLVTGVTAGSGDAIVIQPGGTFTLESGTIQSNAYGILSGSTATVTGGTVIGGTSVLSAVSSGTIAVSGGWFSHEVNSAYCATGYHPATDTTHTPQYTVSNIWTVTFEMQGHGTAPDAQSVVYGGKATEPTTAPTASGYQFGGWYKEAACTNAWNFATDTVTANTTLYAKWTPITYTVVFDGNGFTSGDMEDQTFTFGEEATLSKNQFEKYFNVTLNPNDGTEEQTLKASNTFVGWATSANGESVYDDEASVATLKVTNDVTEINLYAVWSGNVSSVELPMEFRDGYQFDGWFTAASGGTAVGGGGDSYTPTADTTLYAQWTALYSVTFNMQGHGTQIEAITNVVSGRTITAPTDPTEEGWTFGGWYKEAGCTNEWNFSTDTVTANTTLYAKWTQNGFTVTFDANGHGTAPAAVTVEPNCTFTAPTAPTADYYTFVGWYKEAACTNAWNFSTDTVTEDLILYAKWTETTHTVTFNKNNDAATEPQDDPMSQQQIGEVTPAALRANTFALAGYTLAGWNTEAKPTDENPGTSYYDEQAITLTEDVTLYAQWVPAEQIELRYTLNQTVNDTSEQDQETYTYVLGDELFTPYYTYYDFNHWIYDGKEYYDTDDPDNGKGALKQALEAKWSSGDSTPVNLSADFTRQTYTVNMYSWISPFDDETGPYNEKKSITSRLGRSTGVSMSESFTYQGQHYYLQYWLIGPADQLNSVHVETGTDGTTDLKGTGYKKYYGSRTAFFPQTRGNYIAIAYYSTRGPATSERPDISLRIVDEVKEKVGNEWHVSVTVEVMMGEGKQNNFVEAGLYYKRASADSITGFNDIGVENKKSNNDLTTKVKNDAWGGATYTYHFTLKDNSQNLYLYAYAKYGTSTWVYSAYRDGDILTSADLAANDNWKYFDTITLEHNG